ncbi:hypothetical protein E3Q01_00972 [Wallemia mellicola]|uniref:SAC domain-containing protein n=1 Tax=Wallemia mellicola TaxID=1708541 RepID=A0A4V4MQJ2_9BASI|nr:hypothetical protein E3Q14_00687 [Wallemia mellicola]TIC68256.1 hypothetical protein E3Q01_00972 [Wallemia mellicola]
MSFVHDKLRLITSSEAYTLEPVSNDNSTNKSKSLAIDRVTREIKMVECISCNVDSPKDIQQNADSVITVYGVLGIINLTTKSLPNNTSLALFLVVISDREHAGEINNAAIYRATDFKMYPIDRTSTLSQILKHPVDGVLLGLLKNHFNDGNFYFSPAYDLTSSQQRSQSASEGAPMHERTDDRFYWNKFLQKPLLESNLDTSGPLASFLLPVIYGFLEIKPTSIFGQPVTIALIARRSRFRAGTRYFSRGIDESGNVSNFNETEQIVVAQNKTYSHVQCRGSVPIYWSEINTLRYKPDLQIMDIPQSVESLRLHLALLVENYGKATCINLVNQKGYEKPVKDWFENALGKLNHPNIHYEYFDFHSECSKMRWDRIHILLDRLEEELKAQQYFKKEDTTTVNKQSGVFRTNCMDCLDRTNVVQSAVARVVLTAQLMDAGLLGPGDSVSDDLGFIYLFRNIWADHADAVSVTYSGTGALKTDFTRTGKRTVEGAFWDLINSITRYVKNNYYDGSRQDAFDLVLGGWTPQAGASFRDNRPILTRAAPYVLTYSLLMLLSGIVLPRDKSKSVMTFYLFFTNLVALSSVYIAKNGIDYVAWPRLRKLDNVINYQGPGYRSPAHGRGFAWGVGSGGIFAQPQSRIEEIELGKKAS